MYKDIKEKVHFIGIGGIGMSGIAELLTTMKFPVSGSDMAENENTQKLKDMGVKVFKGHKAENIKDVDVVVVSSAIQKNNPEYIEAERRKIPIIPRAEMLAEVMRQKQGISIAGTHGKTTTSSMVATLLNDAGLEPTIAIGGRVDALGGNAKLGAGQFMVVEADESDGSFLSLPSIISVITNIDNDHLDHYGTMENLKKAFVDFANKVPFYGRVIICVDDNNCKEIIPQIHRHLTTYGFSKEADLRAYNLIARKNPQNNEWGFEFDVSFKDSHLGKFVTTNPGRHNVLNTLAVIAIGVELNLSCDEIKRGLLAFKGVKRRFTIRGTEQGVTVVDDYGHHPREIQATICGARDIWEGRLIGVFQPHRYSRTLQCFNEFAESFNGLDLLIVTDIYAAGESPLNVSSKMLVKAIAEKTKKEVIFVEKVSDIADTLTPRLIKDDLVLVMGAGNINKSCEDILMRLKK